MTFRCTYCGRLHRFDGHGWKGCYKRHKSEEGTRLDHANWLINRYSEESRTMPARRTTQYSTRGLVKKLFHEET